MLQSFFGAEESLAEDAGDPAITAIEIFGREQTRGEDNDGNIARGFLCTQFVQYSETIHFGHHQVEQDQVRGLFCNDRERLPTSTGSNRMTTRLLDQTA